MRLSLCCFVTLFLLTGCYSQVPKPTTYPMTYQQKMQAAHHWQVLADDVGNQITRFIKYEDLNQADQFGIYIEPLPGIFGQAFTHMITANLVESDVRVVHKKEKCPVIRFEIQLIKHKAERFNRPVPGTLTALAAGIWVLREISWDTLAALAIPAAAVGDVALGAMATLPKHEVLVTTSVIGTNNRYLLYRNDIYYINDKDWRLYPTELPQETPQAQEAGQNKKGIKEFKVTSAY